MLIPEKMTVHEYVESLHFKIKVLESAIKELKLYLDCTSKTIEITLKKINEKIKPEKSNG